MKKHVRQNVGRCRFCNSHNILHETVIGNVCSKDKCVDRALRLLRQRFQNFHLPQLSDGILKPTVTARTLQSLRSALIKFIKKGDENKREYILTIAGMIDCIILFSHRSHHTFRAKVCQLCRQAGVSHETTSKIIQQLAALPCAA